MKSTQRDVLRPEVGVAPERRPVFMKGEQHHFGDRIARFKQPAGSFVSEIVKPEPFNLKDFASFRKISADRFSVKGKDKLARMRLPHDDVPGFLSVFKPLVVPDFLGRVLEVSDHPCECVGIVVVPSKTRDLGLSPSAVDGKPHDVCHRVSGSVPLIETISQPNQLIGCRSTVAYSWPGDQVLLPTRQQCILNRLQVDGSTERPHGLEHYLQPYEVVSRGRAYDALTAACGDVPDQLPNGHQLAIPGPHALPNLFKYRVFGPSPVLDALVFFNVLINSLFDAVAGKIVPAFQIGLTLQDPRIGKSASPERFAFSVYNLSRTLDAYFSAIADPVGALTLGDGSHASPTVRHKISGALWSTVQWNIIENKGLIIGNGAPIDHGKSATGRKNTGIKGFGCPYDGLDRIPHRGWSRA